MLGATGLSAQPVGPSVVAGQAQVSSSGATTFVNQSTAKAIINWQDFSVAQGAAVQFNQPNSAAITLNRVTGSNISTINGAIRANGQVWLLNPNGLLIGGGASINVGGLLATTSDIANQDFVEGRYNFSSGRGAIVNNGTIKASDGGSVILSAPKVTNRGLIQANAGHVVLGGTDTFTVDFNGDHLLSYAVGASAQAGQVSNEGKIQAQGGRVLMTARAASGVQDAVINNTGMVEATTARSVNGEIILDAGEGAATTSGTLDASGRGGNESGGTVKVLGGTVAVADNAVIDVSGTRGGGTALIGGNFHGGGSEIHARNTSVGKAVIKADATVSGNGGNVAIWSDGTTDYAGAISAQGGAMGGNGGQVETSGHNLHILSDGSVNALAPRGVTGQWLLDPADIIIDAAGVTAHNETFASDNFSGTSTITATTIDTALRSADLSLQASDDITVNAAVTINNVATAGRTLTLEAGRSIVLNQSISYPGGNIVMIAASLDPNVNPTYRLPGAAFISAVSSASIGSSQLDLTLNTDGTDGGSIGTSSLPLTLIGSPNTYLKTLNASAWLTTGPGSISSLIIGNSNHPTVGLDVGTGNANLNVVGVTQSAPIFASNLTISLPSGITSGNAVTLTNTSNAITGFVNIAAQGRTANGAPYVQLTNSQALTLAAVSTISNTSGDTGPRGAASFRTTSGDINLTGAVNVSGLTLTSAGKITEIGTPAIITSFSVTDTSQPGSAGLTLSSMGAITLNNANQIAQVIGPTGVGNGTQVTLPGLLSVTTQGAGDVSLNFTSNLRLLQSTIAGGAFSLTTSGTYQLLDASGAATILNKSIQVFAPLTVSGATTLISGGDVTQSTGAAITTPSLAATAGVTNSILLNQSVNAIGTANLGAGTNVLLYDQGNLTLAGVKGASAGNSIPSGTVNVQATGNITIGPSSSGSTAAAGQIMILHAGGSILASNGTSFVLAPSLSLIADSGTIGTLAQTLGITTSSVAMRTNNRDISILATQLNGTNTTISGIVTTASGLISATNVSGINAGTGKAQLNGGGAVNWRNFSNAQVTNSVTSSELRISGASVAITGASITSLTSVTFSGDLSISTLGGFQILDSAGAVGLNSAGAIILNALGSITQGSGVAGNIIAANGLTASVNSTTGNLLLTNGLNKVSGSVSLNAPGNISFFNSVSTNLFRASYIPAQTAVAAQLIDIEVFGQGNTLTVGTGANQNGTSIYGDLVTLQGVGGILQGGVGTITANGVSLISAGGAGSAAAPLLINTSNLGANVHGNLYVNAGAGIRGYTSLNLGGVANLFPNGGFVSGISAGSGNIQITANALDVFGPSAISGNNLNISAKSVQLDNAAVTSLSASAVNGGTIDISSDNGFQLNNLGGGPAISTTGNVFFNVNIGSLTQASGASGAITAGTLSTFAVGGNNLNNPANAISGRIEFGSLGDATLVNSLATNLGIGLAGGTFTVQSAGDLTLLAGPTIATQLATQGVTIDNPNVLAAISLSQLGGIIVSLKTSGDGIVLATSGNFINNAGATALLVPAGARFLIYSKDPATDVFGGLKTSGGGIFNATYPGTVPSAGNRYIFSVASSTNTDFIAANNGLNANGSTAAAPALVGFVNALQPPPRNPPPPPPPTLGELLSMRPPPPPPPPPPPRLGNGPLADLSGPNGQNSEPPSSSDQATSYVASSLDGGPPPVTAGTGGSGTIIPRFLRASTPPPSGTLADPSVLSGFGNASLWQ